MKKYLRKIMKKEKAAASLLILVTVGTFAIILMGAYLTVTTLRRSQVQSDIRIQEIYEKDVDRADEIYEELIRNADSKIANAPNTTGFNKSETFYVTWNLESSPYEVEDKKSLNQTAPENWYDYTEGINKWANIKTTGGDNECYWVWIPRYAYKVPSKTTEGTIDVKFLKGKTNVPLDGSSITISNNTEEESWNVSPGFWWDKNDDGIRTADEELEGIWVAKFEASSSSVSEITLTTDLNGTGGGNNPDLQVRVIPNVTSWRGINIDTAFSVCANLTKTNNSLQNSSNIDSHLMKNSEWGTVAYLSRSKYGKNDQVWNNSYYNDTTNYSPITGLCGNAPDASQMDLTNTFEYNQDYGYNGSTTGNVYGVYDMAGGAWEYVAAYLSEATTNSNYSTLASSSIAKRYKDTYKGNNSIATENYLLNSDKFGDAMYETSTEGAETTSWDSDYSLFAFSTSPVLLRGGCASNGNRAGIFAFGRGAGATVEYNSFRPCIVNTK